MLHRHAVPLLLVSTMSIGMCVSRGPSEAPQEVPPVQFRNADTIPVPERPAFWEAALRYYRGHGETEADRARRAHALLGIDSPPLPGERAPIVLFAGRSSPAAANDPSWLQHVREAHLVAGVCQEPHLVLCGDTVLTTYLRLGVPVAIHRDTVTLRVWETALNPLLCRNRDAVVDTQVTLLRFVSSQGSWAVGTTRGAWHLTSSCALLRESSADAPPN